MDPIGCSKTHQAAGLHDPCLAAGSVCRLFHLGFNRRSRGQRRSPLIVRGRLPELRRRARLRRRRPSATTLLAQHLSPHLVGLHIVRRRPHHPRRQRLEPLVAPPTIGGMGRRWGRRHCETATYLRRICSSNVLSVLFCKINKAGLNLGSL